MMKNRKFIASTLTVLCLSASLAVPTFAAEIENNAKTPATKTVSVLEEGTKNGLTNGLKNGFANGATNGMKNGLAEVLKNGELKNN